MSIPDRIYRIAKYKMGEIKDRMDRLDEEVLLNPELRRRIQEAQSRSDARKELEDSAELPSSGSDDVYSAPLKPLSPLKNIWKTNGHIKTH